jgi:hypothetical protein
MQTEPISELLQRLPAMTEEQLREQRESYVRGEMAMGSDRMEAMQRTLANAKQLTVVLTQSLNNDIRGFPPGYLRIARDTIGFLLEEVDRSHKQLAQASEWFLDYAIHHKQKGDEEKAQRNSDRAVACRAPLAIRPTAPIAEAPAEGGTRGY